MIHRKASIARSRFLLACIVCVLVCRAGIGQKCVTQSQMQAADRDSLAAAGLAFATEMQANDANAIRARTLEQYAKDFGGMADTIASTSPHLKTATFQPDSVWLLDASSNPSGAASPQDAQFFCNLNRSQSSVTFSLQALPAGKYGLAIIDAKGTISWQLAFLMKQSGPGTWQLAGLFPRATMAAGHDGLWYWTEARVSAGKKQSWNAWLQYAEAEQLLKPVEFISTSHLDQLHEEQTRSAPAALSSGISAASPLVVKAKDGTEYLFTSLGPDDSLGSDRIDVQVHFKADTIADPVIARARNQKAASALLGAYPEMRSAFHGVWVYADGPNGSPFASEEPVSKLP